MKCSLRLVVNRMIASSSRTSVGSDDWELDSYVRQLENPESDDPNTWNQRKTLTEILSEIADRRLEDAGFDSWYELDRELRRRKEEEELEDED